MKSENAFEFDVIIVGGGPAGLSAALILGRARRRVLVCDAGRPRNSATRHLHGYLTRDGIAPGEFLQIGRDELQQYSSVKLLATEVTDAEVRDGGFAITLQDGKSLTSRKLLLATGVMDELPDVEGLRDLYGRSVFHCPYCDAWEVRDQPLAVYGRGENASGLALELLLWSRDVVLCSDGPADLTDDQLESLAEKGVPLNETPIARLEGTHGQLERIVFAGGSDLERRAMFFSTGQRQTSDLAKKLGCDFTEQGCVETGEYEATDIPGLYVAGDASRLVQFVVVAAAEGAQAAVAINKELMKEDLD